MTKFIKVTERVYCATDYAASNVTYIITDKSVVVVDTTENPSSAKKTLQELRKITQLPISYIIYTHHHPDHITGAKVFKGETTKIIAQKKFPEQLAQFNRLLPYYLRIREIQFGLSLPKAERGITNVNFERTSKGEGATGPMESGYFPPDILVDDKYIFEEGGVQFELYHTMGETLDHLMIWMPQEKVLLPGDLFYESFPMLSSPMKPSRPVKKWADSLERMRQLQPAYLVPGHQNPIVGTQEVSAALTNYEKAIRYVHDETVKGINQGLKLEEIRQRIRLPNELASLPYLQPIYGCVEWSINGIYRKYTGWYDFNPAHLHPSPVSEFHRALVEASGGSASLVKRAQQALRDRKPQLAVEITDVILNVEPDNPQAQSIAAEAFEILANTTKNGVEINIYRAAARGYQNQLPDRHLVA